MKYLIGSLLMCIAWVNAQEVEPRTLALKKIKSMAGCFAVPFNFFEVQSFDENYTLKAPYATAGYEWVTLVEEGNDNVIRLQHILDFGHPGAVQKHWRQDWVYGPTTKLAYQGAFEKSGEIYHRLQPETVSADNTWTQKIYGVGGEPRGACTSSQWTHTPYESTWTCQNIAPLPRRDYKDGFHYQAMDRGNTLSFFNLGWQHRQDNEKRKLRSSGEMEPMAREVGVNSYIRVEDRFCQNAEAWWKNNQAQWAVVRKAWAELENQKTNANIPFNYFHELGGTPVYGPLYDLTKNHDAESFDLAGMVDAIAIHFDRFVFDE